MIQAIAPSTPTRTTTKSQTITVSKFDQLHGLFNHYFPKLVAAGLMLQGLKGLYTSLKFLLIDFPMLESQLVSHQITQSEINMLSNEAILMIISTVISMFFAIRISAVQALATKRVNTIIGVLLFLGNTQIELLLNQLGTEQILTEGLADILSKIFHFGREVNTTIQQELPPEIQELQ